MSQYFSSYYYISLQGEVVMMKNNLIDASYGIKLVWPGYFEDPLANERVGFPRGYDSRLFIPIGSKRSFM